MPELVTFGLTILVALYGLWLSQLEGARPRWYVPDELYENDD